MAAGNLHRVELGFWLGGSHLKISFGTWPANRPRFRFPLCLCGSEGASVALSVQSGLLGSGNFCFAAPLGFLFQPLLYRNPIQFGVGWGTRSLGLLRRLDQLEVAVA
ncbi:hypothetical protein PS691_05261 [Pseudomonas fluorescens]|uniref:Uncharacterized protein n=1 Tax=Pseudomonas fluorescens TaxID=294 RepID=A0A5E7F7E8_PSEFL|nr:hypothetical protein PS691_05261 [Pseudomonas fluorescens]